MTVIKAGDMAAEIAKLMGEYAADVAIDMKAEAKDVASKAVKELKVTSPEGEGSYKGHYKEGWAKKVESENANSIGIRIYNRKKPSLTHLLENGHAKRGGGRVKGIPHIAPVERMVAEEYEKRLKARLSK